MKLKKLFILPFLLSFVFLTSCEKDEEEIEYVATYPVSGTWAVTYNVETSPGQFEAITDPTTVSIYNTAANKPDRIWIDDLEHFWHFKVNAPVDMTNLSFAGSELTNESYESEVTVTEGKVIKGGSMVKGAPTDSIYFQVSFSDDGTAANPDPYGTIYHVFGHRAF